jgi:osmotically-inducible protein OsmY
MIPDTHIRDDVQRELFYTRQLNAARIGVSVEDGVVTLTGIVDSYDQKSAAIHAAERVAGTRAVACALEIRSPGPHLTTDSGLANAVANILAWNATIPKDRIRICAENGWITLEGAVDTQAQKDVAACAAEEVAGVKGVRNLIAVNPSLGEVKEQIEGTLHRNPTIEDRNILVEVNDDKVILHGEVRSIGEREEAERIAWSTAGVSAVANHLLIAERVAN